MRILTECLMTSAEPLAHKPSILFLEMANEKLKKHKSPFSVQILAEMIKARYKISL